MGGEKVSPKLFSSNRIHKGHGIMDFRILQENENDRNGQRKGVPKLFSSNRIQA